jgi:hypothetical protein
LRKKLAIKCDSRDITQGLTLWMLFKKKKGFKLRILWCEYVLGFDEIRIRFKLSYVWTLGRPSGKHFMTRQAVHV